MRKLHRVLGLVLLAPFLLWTATGLLFLLKPGWGPAYELLDPFETSTLNLAAVLTPTEALRLAGLKDNPERVELGQTALGPVYRVRFRSASSLIDARSGRVVSPLTEEEARAIAASAASRAIAPERYGAVLGSSTVGPAVEVRFAGGAVVTIDQTSLSVSQRGPDTDRIDALYRVHYLQWTGHPTVDRALAIFAIGATWVLAIVGALLLRRPARRQSAEHASS